MTFQRRTPASVTRATTTTTTGGPSSPSFGTARGPYEACQAWREVNEMKCLFRAGQPWTRSDANAFLLAAWGYVGFSGWLQLSALIAAAAIGWAVLQNSPGLRRTSSSSMSKVLHGRSFTARSLLPDL